MVQNFKHDEIIKKSHERSKRYGIEKERVTSKKILNNIERDKLLYKNKILTDIAIPFMEVLFNFLKGSGFFIVLTDAEGCILKVIGDDKIVKAAESMNMIVGAYMDEDSIGTNAMGTTLKENMPIQISAKEHFITAYQRWTCSAAPIHDNNGTIIGTINLTGGSDNVHPHTLGLVVAAVKFIEVQLSSNEVQKELTETNQFINTIVNSISFGILAVDTKGTIKSINKTAATIFGLKTDDNIMGQHAKDFFPNWEDIYESFITGKDYQDEEVILNNKGIKSRYNINLYPIRQGENSEHVIGAVITIKDIQKVFNLVNKYTGMRARYTFDDIVDKSEKMKKLKEYAMNVANSPSTILISGESGTGKEVFAQAIHNMSNRRHRGFVAINCGAIPQNLIESELFGYDDGAFTGGKRGGNPGKFELADGGTIFLDEIGEMPMDMQVNLLRVLQEGCVMRIGGTRYIDIDVRIIAATNKNLLEEIEKGKFRRDLYYRLSVIPVTIPPLRERGEDIPVLIEHFLKIKSLKLNKNVPKINEDMYNRMLEYGWPGNIRELENQIENIVNFDGKTTFEMKNKLKSIDIEGILSLEELEKEAIKSALRKLNFNISKVSKALGISRNSLYAKIKKYEISI